MRNNRITYFIITLTVLFLGIVSRKIADIPLFFGDILYAVLIYFGIRFLFIHWHIYKTFLVSFLFCFSIEILQLVKFDWLVTLRTTTMGHYILGQGFLWSDLICYFIGTSFAFISDKKLVKTQNSYL